MNILAFIGSPRKGSNTDLLVDELVNGALTRGHQAQKVYLYQVDILPCIDCRKCKKDKYICVLDDGMPAVYPQMEAADLIVFGTPNYWYGPSAKTKLLMDRMRPYVANEKLGGKKAAVVIPAAEGPDACGPMLEMFRRSFQYIGMEFAGSVLGTAYERKEILKDSAAMAAAFELGTSF